MQMQTRNSSLKFLNKFSFMMPDALSIVVTTGLGFSVIAGIVSGVCYILSYGLPRKRSKNRLETPWNCSVCGCQFNSIEGILEVEKVVTCIKCKAKACKIKCAKWVLVKSDPCSTGGGGGGGWLCNQCQYTETWFGGLLKAIQPITIKNWYSRATDRKMMVDATMTSLNAVVDESVDSVELQKKGREQVRDFMERLVSALLGGDLDNVSVKKLYSDEKYEALFDRYHTDLSDALTDLGSALHISIANLPINGQSPCSSHAALKQLIQRFIQEATQLPKLDKLPENPTQPDPSTTDRTYEDLLSTAILNKVIQNYQENGVPSSSGSISSSRASTSSRKKCDKEYFLGERNLDSFKKNYDDSSSTTSSLDDWVRTADTSLGSIKYVDSNSLTIKERIDEVQSSEDEDREELLKSNDWQENWYLQKRNFKGGNSPVPVPMLVPNPTSEAKVLIGDREAEDLSDLSDVASDFDEVELEGPPSLNTMLIDSKNIIGGKNITLESEDDASISPFGQKIINNLEASNEILIAADLENSLDSNTEKDLEYTESYASLPRRISRENPKPAPRHSKEKIQECTSNGADASNNQIDNFDSGVTSDEDDNMKLFKGSYSEREKNKWNNAVELANNPYSKELLERRISSPSNSNTSTHSSRLGREFVIRESAKSTGSKHKEEPSSPTDDKNKGLHEDEVIFKAVPAKVQEDDVSDLESSIEPQTPTRPNHLEISSDSDYSMERSYNLQTGQIMQTGRDIRKEIINEASSPEGIKFIQKQFDDTHFDTNNGKNNKRNKFLRSLTQEDDVDSDYSSPKDNHFKLVHEIANETSGEYYTEPISPPAQYKTHPGNDSIIRQSSNLSNCEIDANFDSLSESSLSDADNEINDLKGKQLVKNILGEFSKSFPNLNAPTIHNNSIQNQQTNYNVGESGPNSIEIDEGIIDDEQDDNTVAIKARIKRFDSFKSTTAAMNSKESTTNNGQNVYSLTARSIPRQFRKELKKEDAPIIDPADIISSMAPAEDADVPFPTAKSKIEFFEKLRK